MPSTPFWGRNVNNLTNLPASPSAELIKRVSKDRSIDLKALISSKRKKDISNTRAIISYLAAIELRHSGAKIASELRLSEKSVSRCIERGKKLVDNDKKLLEYLR